MLELANDVFPRAYCTQGMTMMEFGADNNGQGMLVLSLGALAAVITIAVYTELKNKRIPNWIALLGILAGLAIGYLPGGISLRASFAGLAAGFGLLFIFYVFGGIGGGDVKLMGAIGALVGYPLILPVVFYTAIVGGFMAIMLLIWKGRFWQVLSLFRRKSEQTAAPEPREPLTIPYGVAIAAGCVMALFMGVH
ncbi:MAG TPA: peptidase A24 [Verrucomicrobia bacterium]|nr:peptidase A24 [Verrucomicrobiota bacterium]